MKKVVLMVFLFFQATCYCGGEMVQLLLASVVTATQHQEDKAHQALVLQQRLLKQERRDLQKLRKKDLGKRPQVHVPRNRKRMGKNENIWQ